MGLLIIIPGADFKENNIGKVKIPTCKHEYENACDTTCNLCGAVREVAGHNYVDGICTICGAKDPNYVPTCQHQYDNACDTTCNLCGAVREVAGHNYVDGICTICGAKDPNYVPTCQHQYDNACDTTCNLCGATRAVTHSYGEGVVTKDATCTEDGVMTYTCTVCGAVKTESIPATGHNFVDMECVNCGYKYPVTDGLQGLYDLGGTPEATLANHAPNPTYTPTGGTPYLQGECEIANNYVRFSDATNSERMNTYLRIPMSEGLTYIVLFRVPSGARILLGNRSAGSTSAANGVNLRSDGVEFSADGGVYDVRKFKIGDTQVSINSADKFAILAMTVTDSVVRVVRYTNNALSDPLYKFEGVVDAWLTGSTGNAICIGGYSKAGGAFADGDISLAAIHTGVLADPQLKSVCEFVKQYGEHKGLTVE